MKTNARQGLNQLLMVLGCNRERKEEEKKIGVVTWSAEMRGSYQELLQEHQQYQLQNDISQLSWTPTRNMQKIQVFSDNKRERERTVALAEGRSGHPTGRGKGKGLGDVDTKACSLFEDITEAGDLLLDHLLETRAALPCWLGHSAAILHKGQAVSQLKESRWAVQGGCWCTHSDTITMLGCSYPQDDPNTNPNPNHCCQNVAAFAGVCASVGTALGWNREGGRRRRRGKGLVALELVVVEYGRCWKSRKVVWSLLCRSKKWHSRRWVEWWKVVMVVGALSFGAHLEKGVCHEVFFCSILLREREREEWPIKVQHMWNVIIDGHVWGWELFWRLGLGP